jgi:hypothetical protein
VFRDHLVVEERDEAFRVGAHQHPPAGSPQVFRQSAWALGDNPRASDGDVSLAGPEQLHRLDPQGRCNLADDDDGWIANRALNAADVRAMQPGLKSELFLRQTPGLAQTPDIVRNQMPDFHSGEGTGM